MNFLSHATLQPCTMRLRAPTHDLALALVPVEAAPQSASDSAPADDFSRCGWFDSSLELAAGLDVIEHLDSLPDGLPMQAAVQ